MEKIDLFDIEDQKKIIYWCCSQAEYGNNNFRTHNCGEYSDVTFKNPYYLIVLYWKNGDSVKLIDVSL